MLGVDVARVKAAASRRTPNRHRGSGRPLAPATSPDMRVRIRRFRGLRRAKEQPRESKQVEVGSGECQVECGTVGDAPGTAHATGGLCSQYLADAPTTQFREPHSAAFPLLPDHGPQTMSYPLVESFQQRRNLTVAEVALPAPYVGCKFLDHLLQADSSCPSR